MSSRGVTLIELLVVIAVFALIATSLGIIMNSIAIGTFRTGARNRVTEKARVALDRMTPDLKETVRAEVSWAGSPIAGNCAHGPTFGPLTSPSNVLILSVPSLTGIPNPNQAIYILPGVIQTDTILYYTTAGIAGATGSRLCRQVIPCSTLCPISPSARPAIVEELLNNVEVTLGSGSNTIWSYETASITGSRYVVLNAVHSWINEVTGRTGFSSSSTVPYITLNKTFRFRN